MHYRTAILAGTFGSKRELGEALVNLLKAPGLTQRGGVAGRGTEFFESEQDRAFLPESLHSLLILSPVLYTIRIAGSGMKS